jgi:hypothetical protein
MFAIYDDGSLCIGPKQQTNCEAERNKSSTPEPVCPRPVLC